MKTYIIPKGWHYSLHLPKLYDGEKEIFTGEFMFDESAIYDHGGIDQLDVNKLWGVGYGNIFTQGHLFNSIRLGWNWNKDIHLVDWWLYNHNNGARSIQFIESVPLYKKTSFELILDYNDDKVLLTTPTYNKLTYGFNYPKDRLGYYLFPYFGGNRVAPHMIKNKIEIL